MKALPIALVLLSIFLIAISCKEKADLSKNQVFLNRLSELNDLNTNDSETIHNVHFKIGFASRSDFDGYLIYRIISKTDVSNDNEFSILQTSILKSGIVQELENSKSDRRIKELDYQFNYSVEDITFGKSPSYNRTAVIEKMDSKKRPSSLEIIANTFADGSTIYQDIGVIMYQLPLPREPMKTHEDYKEVYQHIKNTHTFNLDSFARDDKYLPHLRDLSGLKRQSAYSFHYAPYVTY